ncbi:MAG: hypothetical protein NTZ20_02485 [Candidatus Levybacteria bacterium]|nr:hypothetical protein [Candidatus Levybacteria bacterium]
MNKSFEILIKKYKKHLIYIVSLIIIILIFITIIIPQVKFFFEVANEEKAYRIRIDILRENEQFISKLDDNELDYQLSMLESALPFEKNFVEIINSISYIAKKIGVKFSDYSITIGEVPIISSDNSDLINKSNNLINSEIIKKSKNSKSIDLTLSLQIKDEDKLFKIIQFIKELKTTVPLVDVLSFDLDELSISTSFYYNPIDSAEFNIYNKWTKLSKIDLQLIENLNKWGKNKGTYSDFLPIIDASSSSNLIPLLEKVEVLNSSSSSLMPF